MDKVTMIASGIVGFLIALLVVPIIMFKPKLPKPQVYELNKINLSIQNKLGSAVEFYQLSTPQGECIVLVNARGGKGFVDMMAMDMRCFE